MELVVLSWFGVFFGSEFWVRVWGVESGILVLTGFRRLRQGELTRGNHT